MATDDKHYDLYENEPLPEGEEAPPPLVHTMSIVRWCILIGLSLFAIAMILNAFGLAPWEARGAETTLYHCPMHPTYTSNQPGECPICGMTLVAVSDISKVATIIDTISEHNKPISQEVKAVKYTCPMHPEVISDKPGKCPKCGMDLIPAKDTSMNLSMPATNNQQMAGHDMSNMGSSPVPGLVPVTIEPERLQLIGIRKAKVETRSLGGGFSIPGIVTPEEGRIRNFHVRINGWVQRLYANQTGQYVEKGQPLMSIYSQDLFQAEQDYLVARDAIKNPGDIQSAELKRRIILSSRERLNLMGLPEEEINQLDTAKVAKQELILRSSFAGYVLEKSVYEGQYVGPDQNLLTIADLSQIWIEGDVYEQDMASLHKGQKAYIKFTAYPSESFEGTVDFIYPSVSEKTRTGKIRIVVANPSLKFRPGMYAEAEIEGGSGMSLVVPSEAVVDGGQYQYAFVVTDQIHFEPRLLKIGRASDDWVEVLSGLSDGEEVVTSANFLIDSESRLKAALIGMGSAPTTGHEGMKMNRAK